ncbi:uncharacterized protein LOC117262505 [Epinephelus lanceolatus]
MVSRGLVPSNRQNPFVVRPNYHNWAPWIGPHTRGSDVVLNTEYNKINQPRHPNEAAEFLITEERLTDEILKLKMEAVRSLCKECGIDSKGSRMDLVMRLRKEMQDRSTYDKVFSKVWGASGGWAVVTCPCAVVYGVKFNLRAESPRDFADLLLSMKHFPNVTLYDFARGLATHTNIREPQSLPFSPHEGRLMDATEENIRLASAGHAKVSLPWLATKKPVPDEGGHPLTGSSEHYALYDRFHEANTKDKKDVLRKIELVPELCGWVNSQCAEQLFGGMRKNNHFLNMMTPSSHIFLMRNILHHYNNRCNAKRIDDMKKTLGSGLEIQLNSNGQTVAATAATTTTWTASIPTPSAASGSTTTSIPILSRFQLCNEDCGGMKHMLHTSAGSSVTDLQLNNVLDIQKPKDEVIGVVGTSVLKRLDFLELGLNREVEATIINCCLWLVSQIAGHRGKDVFAVDGYVISTWKQPFTMIPILSLPLPSCLLEEIFAEVVLSDGDVAILTLSLVCHHFKEVVSTEHFRRKAHFMWLNSVATWSKFTERYRAEFCNMYSLETCRECNETYKNCIPGYAGKGKRGELRGIYSDDSHPGFCSKFCQMCAGIPE